MKMEQLNSKSNLDIRNKRLSYYSKIIENVNKPSQVVTNEQQYPSNTTQAQTPTPTPPAYNFISSYQTDENFFKTKSESFTNESKKYEELDKNSIKVLERIFGNPETPISTNNRHQLFDFDTNSLKNMPASSSSSTYNNPKLEEFKKVVENSYAVHVLNKNENLSRFSSVESTPRNNFNFKSNIEDNAFGLNSLSSFNSERKQSDETPNTPLKIPYMSAYNIYNSNDSKNQLELFDTSSSNVAPFVAGQKLDTYDEINTSNNISKKNILTSAGSSLNTSPTSVSSSNGVEPIKNDEFLVKLTSLPQQIPPSIIQSKNEPPLSKRTPREVRPPETPRTNKTSSNLSYRRNLLMSQSKSIDKEMPQSNMLTKQTSLDINETPFLINNKSNSFTNSIDSEIKKVKVTNHFDWEEFFESPIIKSSTNGTFNKKKFLQPIEKTKTNQSVESNKKIVRNSNKKPNEINKKPTRKSNNNNNKQNLFNYMMQDAYDMNDQFNYERSGDEDEQCDTLDIFTSSDEDDTVNNEKKIDKVEKATSSNASKFDLKIDLGQLSSGEEDNSLNQKEQGIAINKWGKDDIIKEEKFTLNDIKQSSRLHQTNSANQQVKPDIIPNLCLDTLNLDEDKSQSVAVSLAKSMCKEIDYHKEMEMIFKLDEKKNKEQQLYLDHQVNKNKSYLKIESVAAKTSSMTQQQQLQQQEQQQAPSFLITNNLKNHSKLNNLSLSNKLNINRNNLNSINNNGTNSLSNIPSNNNTNNINNQDALFKVKTDQTTNTFLKPPKSSARQQPSTIDLKGLGPLRPSSAASTSHYLAETSKSIMKPNNNISSFKKSLMPPRPNSSSTNNNALRHSKIASNSTHAINKATLSTNFSNVKPPNSSDESPREQQKVRPKQPHWNTSTSVTSSFQRKQLHMQRSCSALSSSKVNPLQNKNSVNNNQFKSQHQETLKVVNQNNQPMLFTYSKLIEIESKMKTDFEDNEIQANKRPNSEMGFISNKLLNSVNLKFDLPLLSTDLIKKDEPAKLGDQQAYVELMLNNLVEQVENKVNAESDDEKENEENPVEWLSLPDEIWLNIFKYLRQVDLVRVGSTCKTLNNLYVDNSLWRCISVKYNYNVCDEWLNWIGRRRPNELNIIQCSGNISLYAISEMFRNIGDELKALNLSRCSNEKLSADNFALQASIRCKNVTNLDLSWTLLSNQTLKLIADSFIKIESINLSGCNMIQEEGFNFLLTKHGESLKNLEISGCLHFSSSIIINIGAYCRNLEKLNISNCHRMSNESIIEACPHWLKLKHLDLRGIKNIKNNCISILVRKCAHLEGLALAECIHIGDTSVLEIATYKQNIKYLDLNGCKKISDNSLRSLANFCSKLEYLNLKATNVTDTGLITISNGKFMKILQEINLSFLPVSEYVVMKLLGNLTKLKAIHLYGCYNIKHIDELKKSTVGNPNEHYLSINI